MLKRTANNKPQRKMRGLGGVQPLSRMHPDHPVTRLHSGRQLMPKFEVRNPKQKYMP